MSTEQGTNPDPFTEAIRAAFSDGRLESVPPLVHEEIRLQLGREILVKGADGRMLKVKAVPEQGTTRRFGRAIQRFLGNLIGLVLVIGTAGFLVILTVKALFWAVML